jgi:Domain of unknown function (DUF4760)
MDANPGLRNRIPITLNTIWMFCAMGVVLVLAYHFLRDFRDDIVLMASLLAAAWVIYGAMVAVDALQEQARLAQQQLDEARLQRQQVQQQLAQMRMALALSFFARWNDPALEPTRKIWRDVMVEARGREDAQRTKMIEEDANKRAKVVAVLNFFEEIAAAVKQEAVDEAMIRVGFRSLIREAYPTLKPWIEKHRENFSQSNFRLMQDLGESWRD